MADRAKIPVDTDTTTPTCYVNGLHKSEHEEETRGVGRMETYNRKEFFGLVHHRIIASPHHRIGTMKKQRQDSKVSSNFRALITHARDGRRGGRGGRGGGNTLAGTAGRQGKSGGGNDTAEDNASDEGQMCYN